MKADEIGAEMMSEPLPSEKRSRNMGQVRSKNTNPEMIVRRTCYKLGYRFRLHGRNLPGTPDLVFAGRRKVIFVHGCFWHRHRACKRASVPATRKMFWETKFARNVARDQESVKKLRNAGWEVLVIWECSLKDAAHLENLLKEFLHQVTGSLPNDHTG